MIDVEGEEAVPVECQATGREAQAWANSWSEGIDPQDPFGAQGCVAGATRTFSTPWRPSEPSPPTTATQVDPLDVTLSWMGQNPFGGNYSVYLDVTQPPTRLACASTALAQCTAPAGLLFGTTYYWQVVAPALDQAETPIWSFTTDVFCIPSTAGAARQAKASTVDGEEDGLYLAMLVCAPDDHERQDHAAAAGADRCGARPVLRETLGGTQVPALKMSCGGDPLPPATNVASLSGDDWRPGECSIPSAQDTSITTPIWYTVYVDSKFVSERDEIWEAGYMHAYLGEVLDGEEVHGIFQPDVPLCLNYVLPVPLDPYRGDIDTREQLEHLGRYESNFTDAGQFTIVMGWDPIDVGGGRYNGVAVESPLSSNPTRTAMYFHWWEGDRYVGLRTAFHEIGHVFIGPTHSDCTTQMANHRFVHIMAFAKNRHTSCHWGTGWPHQPIWHWIFKGPDANIVKDNHESWCEQRRGGDC